ncbi:MAG: FKBP-type peptidyl-prolyl cis-trans isomerase [Clostridia bacterium]|nr:FKBP-type peptidyl-prolyl cis-trans isomerase [Clostridia bacterium]
MENLKYKGLKLQRPKVEDITEEEILAELERFRRAQAETVEITDETRILKEGDCAHIDFTGYVDGEKFEGGEAKCYDLVIGSHQFIPGFEEGMVGMKIGEERDVKVTFPTEYVPTLAGKDAIFKVLLHAIKEKKEVELSDEHQNAVDRRIQKLLPPSFTGRKSAGIRREKERSVAFRYNRKRRR